jgi:anion transporter
MPKQQKKADKHETGYDKYINWKIFIIPVALFFAILLMPTGKAIRDVGTEYSMGPKTVIRFLSKELFDAKTSDLQQWQLLTVQVMEKNMRTAALDKDRFMGRDDKWLKKNKVAFDKKNLERAKEFVGGLGDKEYRSLMERAADERMIKLDYSDLKEDDVKAADDGIWKLKVALAMLVFTVGCFLTACIPLPAVAFCIGLIVVLTGIVSREEVAALYWSDSVWFIMGSLMFATAFVKTGVDKRITMLLFKRLAVPSVGAITFIILLVVGPASSFISDHALAAIFLPVAIMLFQGSRKPDGTPDLELAKMLILTVACAANIGGPGSPSGGARNVIMITYLKDMFGVDISYIQWLTYGMPFVIIMIPLTWLCIKFAFKPTVKDLTPSMELLKSETDSMGRWNYTQIVTVVVFLLTLWFWMTEQTFFDKGWYPVRLGVGVIAIAAGIAYVLTGVVNWRDYHEKVDWGVVWLYAGAILFGKILDESGGAYLIARTMVAGLAHVGLDQGLGLIASCGILTGGITQLMADGPAAAAVGPVTLNMAGMVHPGTVMLPFMAMATGISASFAYCLIIGTPPNAIVYASGYLEPKDFLRAGIPLWIIAQIVMLLLVAFYWLPRGFGNLPGL